MSRLAFCPCFAIRVLPQLVLSSLRKRRLPVWNGKRIDVSVARMHQRCHFLSFKKKKTKQNKRLIGYWNRVRLGRISWERDANVFCGDPTSSKHILQMHTTTSSDSLALELEKKYLLGVTGGRHELYQICCIPRME